MEVDNMEVENIELNNDTNKEIMSKSNMIEDNNYNDSIIIVGEDIFKIYNNFNFINNHVYVEYNLYDYKFTDTFKFDVIMKFYKKKILLSIEQKDYSSQCEDNIDYLYYHCFNFKNDDEILENIKLILNKIYNFKYDFCYSKIKNYFIPKENLENEEKIYLAKKILSHDVIENCSICLEPNTVTTICKHNLCKECYYKIIDKKEHPKCPICRMCLNCLGHE